MGMHGQEAQTFCNLRILLLQAMPYIKVAAKFKNPFGGFTDKEPVYFPRVEGMDVTFSKEGSKITITLEPTKSRKAMKPGFIGWMMPETLKHTDQ